MVFFLIFLRSLRAGYILKQLLFSISLNGGHSNICVDYKEWLLITRIAMRYTLMFEAYRTNLKQMKEKKSISWRMQTLQRSQRTWNFTN